MNLEVSYGVILGVKELKGVKELSQMLMFIQGHVAVGLTPNGA